MIERLRAWAREYTEQDRYSPVGVAFHWIMAALVLFQLGWGWYSGMVAVGGDKVAAYQLHAEIGLLILVLALLRMVWRIMIPDPINDADTQGWKTSVAHATHIIFYICFFGLPLSGWAMWSALGEAEPLAIAGLIPWPPLPLDSLPTHLQWMVLDWAEDVHAILIVTLLVLIPLHVGAALKHHFWDRDDVLEGMLPDVPDAETPRAKPTRKPPAPQSRPA
jgi:cytochrome b561